MEGVRKARRAYGLGWMGPYISLTTLILAGCMASTGILHESLDEVARADLQIILDEIPPNAKSARLAKPYYVVEDFEQFHGDTALVYQGRATLVFFYLDPSVGLCQIRKYRYKRSARSWDRYLVELKYIPTRYLDSSGALIRPD